MSGENMPNKFYQKMCGDFPPYIIAEIGANHNGDMDLAKKIIDSAKDCGCDAVKFQSWSPQSLIAKEEYDRNSKYYDSPHKHFGSLREMVEKYYLRADQHFELKEYCHKREIEFCSSPFSNEEVDLLKKVDVPFFKVASMDIDNLELLKYISQTRKPVLISTGMSTLAEIERAIQTIEKEGNREIVLLHCISIYPPQYEDINLKNIPMLQQAFGYPVGFSDHSIGTAIPLSSIALGSCVIEKHFTLDKKLPGWDHEISADPGEMAQIVLESNNIFKALGTSKRIVSNAEEQKKTKFRRSIVVKDCFPIGHKLRLEDLDSKRPGTGISPGDLRHVIGRELKRTKKADDLIFWEDLL
jgi:N-acetylneuraminate synthase